MSTRAIVGYERTDGTIIGTLCENDGHEIKNNLKRDFKSLLDVNFILDLGKFKTICSKKEYEDSIKRKKEKNIDISRTTFIPYGKSIILQDNYDIGKDPIEYKNIEDIFAQDINVAYIFKNGKWEEYR